MWRSVLITCGQSVALRKRIHFGVTSTFYRADEKYMVRTDGLDGAQTDFEIAYVFGYYPLEQFLIRFPDGRLQALKTAKGAVVSPLDL